MKNNLKFPEQDMLNFDLQIKKFAFPAEVGGHVWSPEDSVAFFRDDFDASLESWQWVAEKGEGTVYLYKLYCEAKGSGVRVLCSVGISPSMAVCLHDAEQALDTIRE